MKRFFLEDAREGQDSPTTSFLVKQRSERRTKAGKPYLSLTLCDKTGQIEAKIWDFADTVSVREGQYVVAKLCFERFNGSLQATVKVDHDDEGRAEVKIRAARPDEVDPADYLPATKYDIDELWTKLRAAVDEFADEHLRSLLTAFLNDAEIAARLRKAPAARALHHARLGGLLEHKVELVEVCKRVAPAFPEIQLDLLVSGAMLHDIGKIYELTYDTAFNYTVEGELLGHIAIGLRLIREKLAMLPDFPPRMALLLEHIVLSHHGHYEFGSAKLPMTPEAMMLHMLDDLCAKMELFRGELTTHARGGDAARLTHYIRALERPILDSRAFLADEAVAEAVGGPALASAELTEETQDAGTLLAED